MGVSAPFWKIAKTPTIAPAISNLNSFCFVLPLKRFFHGPFVVSLMPCFPQLCKVHCTDSKKIQIPLTFHFSTTQDVQDAHFFLHKAWRLLPFSHWLLGVQTIQGTYRLLLYLKNETWREKVCWITSVFSCAYPCSGFLLMSEPFCMLFLLRTSP